MLFGPMPAIWVYKKVSEVLDSSRPATRRAVLNITNQLYDFVRFELESDNVSDDEKADPDLEHLRRSSFQLRGGFDGGNIPVDCLRTYMRIVHDTRLRHYRIQDSTAMLKGDLKPTRSKLAAWLKDYQVKYRTTMKVSKGLY